MGAKANIEKITEVTDKLSKTNKLINEESPEKYTLPGKGKDSPEISQPGLDASMNSVPEVSDRAGRSPLSTSGIPIVPEMTPEMSRVSSGSIPTPPDIQAQGNIPPPPPMDSGVNSGSIPTPPP